MLKEEFECDRNVVHIVARVRYKEVTGWFDTSDIIVVATSIDVEGVTSHDVDANNFEAD